MNGSKSNDNKISCHQQNGSATKCVGRALLASTKYDLGGHGAAGPLGAPAPPRPFRRIAPRFGLRGPALHV